MLALLTFCAIFGCVLGICHAVLIIQAHRDIFGGSLAEGLWPALWAVLLWTLLGPILVMVLIGWLIWVSCLQIGRATAKS